MFRVIVLPARRGDCLWIEYGPEGGPVHRILVDGGTRSAGRDLADRLRLLPETEPPFELVVVTHIDEDHIGGLLHVLEQEALPAHHLWFNGLEHLADDLLHAGHGEQLTSLLNDRPEIRWNEQFGGGPVVVPPGADPLTRIPLPGGMMVTVLSPDPARLTRLERLWRSSLEPPTEDVDDDDLASELLGSEAEDGAGAERDLNTLAQSAFEEDQSPTNGSSIALLLEYGGKRALLTGDAFPSVLLNAAKRLPMTGPIDLFKLSHHGSQRNTSPELLRAFDCRNFLFCTNGGGGHGHPCPETVARVVTTRPCARLLFNYRVPATEAWADPALVARYGYETVFPSGPNGELVIDLHDLGP